ncbi:sensor histidine kinase [Streptomyces longwoodensis]|uniref:sensor histidine kinase n=1 Tax=Streptomyces longwoodensis TaxID=68231 RepID=UPI0038300CAA
MSHLRAPAARADRREGGRHGRPVARPAPAPAETHIRPQLMRLALFPPVAVALAAGAAVLVALRAGRPQGSPTLWAVLGCAVGVSLAGILIAAVAADRTARSMGDRITTLRRHSARREADLHALVEALRRGDTPPRRGTRGRPPADGDEFDALAADLASAHDGAVAAVVRAAQLSSQAGSEQKLEVFVNLARRLQSLVHREISLLDELENEIEDPDLLKGLFHVDHLATRIRRHAENLAVLGGAVSRRQWSNPVSMTEVLRSAIAEVEQYSRVKLVPPVDGELRGHAVADVIHLLAELVENATVFSAPHTQVLLRANLVTSGLAVEVEDRGLGIPADEQQRMNALLADPDQVNVGRLLADGRIGLFVVSQLARRHGIRVRLQNNIYGGVQAVLVVPQALLGPTPGTPAPTARGVAPQQAVAQGDVAQGAVAQGPVPSTAPRPEPDPTGAHHLTPPAPPAPAHAPAPAPVPVHDTTGAHATVVPLPAPDPAGGHDGPAGPAEPHTRPAPLPLRGAHRDRPTPAHALPGVRADDRQAAEGAGGHVSVPRTGAVRGTMGRPHLPRRRAQEHIAPQLRGGPLPRQDGEPAGHDPGLMAAFQRGIGLAESRPGLEDGSPAPAPAPLSEAYPAHTAAAVEAYGVRGVPDAPGPDHPTPRHDGSAPAG